MTPVPVPDDPASYLVYADWLEEEGEQERAAAAREDAAFLRAALECWHSLGLNVNSRTCTHPVPVATRPFGLGVSLRRGHKPGRMKVRVKVWDNWPLCWGQAPLPAWEAQMVNPQREEVLEKALRTWGRARDALPLWGRRVALLERRDRLGDTERTMLGQALGLGNGRRLRTYTSLQCFEAEKALDLMGR